MARWKVGRFFRLISLLAGLFFIGVWIRSHFANDLLTFTTPHGTYVEVATIPDQFRITIVEHWPKRVGLTFAPVSQLPPRYPVFGQGAVYHRWFPLGFAVRRGARAIEFQYGPMLFLHAAPTVVSYSQWAIPFPLPVSLCAAICFWPLIRRLLRRRREEARVIRGFCSQCGYDLRATPGRCPECVTERDLRLKSLARSGR